MGRGRSTSVRFLCLKIARSSELAALRTARRARSRTRRVRLANARPAPNGRMRTARRPIDVRRQLLRRRATLEAHTAARSQSYSGPLCRGSRAKREREAVREVGGLRGRRIAEVSLDRLRSSADEAGLPLGSPGRNDPRVVCGCSRKRSPAALWQPDRGSRARVSALAELRDPLCRDHGQSVNVKPFERLVAFGAGGSRR